VSLARLGRVTDQGDAPAADESPQLQAFLAQRRLDVLARAIRTLETCAPSDLAAEAHRLAGTLGIFGFDDASAAVRLLERAAEQPDALPGDIDDHRMRTLAVLRGIDSGSTSEEPG
jgi:HPt (histidine-containing phosphotransfer) domain-containing protein